MSVTNVNFFAVQEKSDPNPGLDKINFLKTDSLEKNIFELLLCRIFSYKYTDDLY